ncbi:MAG: methyltransferase domain-containing protein [Longimicrobiales bacterium]
MDSPGDWASELEGNFVEMAWTNRWFGGLGSIQRSLGPLVAAGGGRVLDVGTGAGQTFRELGDWSAKRGAPLQLVALDRSADFLALAGRNEQTLLRCAGDGLRLPFPSGTFDAVLSLQTLHHLNDAQAVTLIREMVRVSRALVVISDLRRGILPYLGAEILAHTVWRNPLTRHDGPVSVRRGFTPEELARLGVEGGAKGCAVRRYGPFRIVLEWVKP